MRKLNYVFTICYLIMNVTIFQLSAQTGYNNFLFLPLTIINQDDNIYNELPNCIINTEINKYIIWNRINGNVLVPQNCERLTIRQLKLLDSLYSWWYNRQLDFSNSRVYLILNSNQIKKFKFLQLIGYLRTNWITFIDNGEDTCNNALFYIFIFDKRSQPHRLNYIFYKNNQLYEAQNPIIGMELGLLFHELRSVTSIKDEAINKNYSIILTGYWNNSEFPSDSRDIINDDRIRIINRYKTIFYISGRILNEETLNFFIISNGQSSRSIINQLDDLTSTEFQYNGLSYHTNLYKDIIYCSTLDRINKNIILSYFKTQNFHISDSVHINEQELRTIILRIDTLWRRYGNINNHPPDTLYIKIIGFADRNGEGSPGFMKANRILAESRAKLIQRLINEYLIRKNIPHRFMTVRACDERYFYGKDRSVEITVWIRNKDEFLPNLCN